MACQVTDGGSTDVLIRELNRRVRSDGLLIVARVANAPNVVVPGTIRGVFKSHVVTERVANLIARPNHDGAVFQSDASILCEAILKDQPRLGPNAKGKWPRFALAVRNDPRVVINLIPILGFVRIEITAYLDQTPTIKKKRIGGCELRTAHNPVFFEILLVLA